MLSITEHDSWPPDLGHWKGNATLAYEESRFALVDTCQICTQPVRVGQKRSLIVEVQMRPDTADGLGYLEYQWAVTHTRCHPAELRVVVSGETPPTEVEALYTLLTAQLATGASIAVALIAPSVLHTAVGADGERHPTLVVNCRQAGFGQYKTDDLGGVIVDAPRVRAPAVQVKVTQRTASIDVAVAGKPISLMREVQLKPGHEAKWRDVALTQGEVLVITGTAVYINPTDASDFQLIRKGQDGVVLACYTTLAAEDEPGPQ